MKGIEQISTWASYFPFDVFDLIIGPQVHSIPGLKEAIGFLLSTINASHILSVYFIYY